MTRPRFNRILLKLSGEALMGQGQFGIDPAAVAGLAPDRRHADFFPFHLDPTDRRHAPPEHV